MVHFLPGKLRIIVALFISVSLFALPAQKATAVISACSASVGITSVQANTTQSYSFSVTNDSENAISWIRVTVPSANFTLAGGVYAPDGWSGAIDGGTLTVTGGSLDPSGSYSFSVQATSADVNASSADWTVQVSDDSGGSDPTGCTGSLSTAITGGNENPDADVSAPTISSIVVSDITDTSAKITWTTDEASSTSVDYGGDESYGSTVSGDGNTTSHTVTITGLSANTTYHYDASSVDSAGNTANAGDNTFSTAKSGYTGTTVTGTVTTVTTIIRSTPAPTPIPDRIPPKVLLTTKLKSIYTQPPQIEGKVSDPSGVASVEYSVDNGANFLPVDDFVGAGKTSGTFVFIPFQTDDGTYKLVLRATDVKGNTGKTVLDDIVIDRLPPAFGAYILHAGPLILSPTSWGIEMLPGMVYGITLSAVGGPTEAKILLMPLGGIATNQLEILLQKNVDSGLWSGRLSIETPGDYSMKVVAVDGAGNITTRDLGVLRVVVGGRVQNPEGEVLTGATITLHYLDTATHQFRVWDGASYGVNNPVTPEANSSYGLLIPPGSYYVRVTSPGYQPVVSSIFTVKRISGFTHNFVLKHARAIRIGPWSIPLPDFTQRTVSVNVTDTGTQRSENNSKLIGTPLPFFRFKSGAGMLSALDLRGKPTILTILNSWSPISSSQLSVLDSLATSQELNSAVAVPQETDQSVAMFAKRGAYSVKIVADPDGLLIDALHIQTSPTHIIVDRKGIIRSVIQGLATKEELMEAVIQ